MTCMHIVRAATLLFMLAACNPARAQTPDGHCAGADYSDDLGIARVSRSAAKVNFIRGAHSSPACPNASEACRDKPFLVGGDVVLTSEKHGDFVCATFVNARTIETIGWLPAAALETMPAPALPAAQWHGTWRRIEAQIRIKPATGGGLSIDGTAAWGSHDPERVARGSVRIGEISATTKPTGNSVFFSDEPAPSFEKVPENVCAVRMRRIAQYLVVEDNRSCGGMNVSFSGIYVKR